MSMGSDPRERRQRGGWRKIRLLLLALAVVTITTAVALTIFLCWLVPRSAGQTFAVTALDVGFLQDMTTHHEQAVGADSDVGWTQRNPTSSDLRAEL